MTRAKHNAIAFIVSALTAAPLAATLLTPQLAQAGWKRYSASSVCTSQTTNHVLNDDGSFTGVTPHVEGTANQTVICALPSSSSFQQVTTNRINVHVRRVAPYSSGWWFGVRACVQDYDGYTNYCNDAIAVPSSTGEFTAQLTGSYLNYFRNSSYSSWGGYVYTWFRAGDLVRFIYQVFD